MIYDHRSDSRAYTISLFVGFHAAREAARLPMDDGDAAQQQQARFSCRAPRRRRRAAVDDARRR